MKKILLSLLLLAALPLYAQLPYDEALADSLYDNVKAASELYKTQPDESVVASFREALDAYLSYVDGYDLRSVHLQKGKRLYANINRNKALIAAAGYSSRQLLLQCIAALSPYPDDLNGYKELGKAYYTLGTLYNMQRDGRRALAVLQAADTIFQRTYGPDHLYVGYTANAMASSYELFGNYGASTVQYLRAIDINQRKQNRSSLGRAYNNLGTLYRKQDLLDKADTAFTKALQVYDFLRTDEEMETGTISTELLLSIAKTKFNLGELRRDKMELQAAYAIQLELLQLFRDRPDLEDLDNTTHPDVHHALAGIYHERGQEDSAFYHIDRAIALYDEVAPAYGRRQADVHLSKSEFLQAQRRYSDALKHCRIALQRATDQPLNIDAPLVLPSQGVAQGNPVVIRVLSAMAGLYLKAENDAPTAMRIGDFLVKLSDQMRRELAYEDQILLGGALKEGLDVAVMAAYSQYEQSPTDAHFDRLLQFSERKKAVALTTLLNQVAATQNGGLPPALRMREEHIRDQLRIYRGFLQNPPSDLAENTWLDSLQILEAEYQSLTQTLEKNYPKYYDLKYQSPTTHLAELSALLPAESAVLSYSLVSDALYVIGLSPKGHFARSVPLSTQTLADAVTAFHNLSQNNALIQSSLRKQYMQKSSQLYQWLIAPIADNLADVQHLHIIPEGALFYLPFESLSPTAASDFTALPTLLRTHAITYHYSASKALQPATHLNGKGLLAIAPVEHDAPSAVRSTLGDLPFAEKEVTYIAKRYRAYDHPTQTLLKSQATKAQFIKAATDHPYKVIHLSTHSKPQPKAPDLSTLFFHEEAADYRLYARELFNLNISTELLVMSSCESGIGNVADGEGMISLNRGFLYAGAQNIVFSIWQVNDQYTMQLMQYFHDEVLKGKPYAQALRSAKLRLIDEGQLAALPVYWSGFLLLSQ